MSQFKLVDGEVSAMKALGDGIQPLYLPALFRQQQAAEEWASGQHKKLLELGFEWDGMDGYTAPEGMTLDQLQEVLK